MLMKTAGQSLTEQLTERFAERIRTRLLAPGARLPSVRQCAQQQAVSPATVVAAYDRLSAMGLVQARRNRGFFVREASADTAPGSAAAGVGRSASIAEVRSEALNRGIDLSKHSQDSTTSAFVLPSALRP